MRAVSFFTIILIGVLFLPIACAPAGPPKTARIEVQLEYPLEQWRPSTISVAVGGTVTWTNRGEAEHSVISGEGLWADKILFPGESFSYTFTELGTYTYHDNPYSTVDIIYVE